VSGLRLVLIVALGAASPRGSAAQDVAARMDGRVPADVARAVQAIAEGARARGLPVEPLIQKATAGLTASQVRELVRLSQPSYDPALTLHVAATLTALGVPPEQSLQVMERRIQARQGANELLDLPNEVEVGMARGATPAEATREVEETESQQGVTSTSAAPPPPKNRPARANPHKP
jgi:HAMP domain-containing protein